MDPQTITYKIKADRPDELDKFISGYTGMFYKPFTHFDKSEEEIILKEDKFFSSAVTKMFGMSQYMYANNCVTDVQMNISSYEEKKKEKLELIPKLQREITRLSKLEWPTKREKRNRIKTEERLQANIESLARGICFGGKDLLREITKLSQMEKPSEKQVELLVRKKKEFKYGRVRQPLFVGCAKEGGNRYFEFHLDENHVLFKISRNNHVRLELSSFGNNRKEVLHLLQCAINNNELPVTVRLSKKEMKITFDTERLYGFGFDVERYNQLKKDRPDLTRKEAAKIIFDEQKEKKLAGKKRNRVAGIDQNPDEIGFSIVDVDPITNLVKKVVFTKRYDLRQLSESNCGTKGYRKYIRGKQRHEIREVYKDIFMQLKRYNVSRLGVEDLEFKDFAKYFPREYNRKTKNVWYRGLQEETLNRRSASSGTILEYVEPQYSSFIGNNMFPQYHDCIGASIEIGRRSYTKYLKDCPNRLFPSMENHNNERLSHLAGMAVTVKNTWVLLYNECKKACYGAEGWWRNKSSTVGNNLFSHKSMVTFHCS